MDKKDELDEEENNSIGCGDLFGKFPRKSKKTAQELKDEVRLGWK